VAGSLVGRIPRPRGALDAHVAVTFPGEKIPVEMDFYLDPQNASPGPAGSVVQVRVSDSGFSPARIAAEAGKPMTLRFLRTSRNTCATEVVFPEQGIRRELPLGVPVEVAVIPHSGEIAFSCGMHMFKGQIVSR
jgi:plastocyanin domain-containing protein